MGKPMNEIAKAETVLGDLVAKRDAHVQRGGKLADDRREIAFAANTGDHSARKKLDALNHEAALHQSELENLNAAIEEATTRLGAARRSHDRAADRGKAQKLHSDLLPKLIGHGAKIDEALAVIVAESILMRETLHQVRSCGCTVPSDQQLHVNAAMVIYSALMQTPWRREFRHMAPHELRTFASLFVGKVVGDGVHQRAGWAPGIENFIQKLLGETPVDRPQPEDAAA